MADSDLPQVKHDSQPSLTGRRLAVYTALLARGAPIAAMYLSAVDVMSSANAEREVLASHALREMIEKLPGFVGIEAKRGGFNHKSRVDGLRKDWTRAVENSAATTDGSDWNGQIDGPLRRLLRRLAKFLEDAARAHLPYRDQLLGVVRQADPLSHEMPAELEAARLAKWVEFRDFFQAVSHHRKSVTVSETRLRIEAFEDFLLDHLRPRTTRDHAAIQALIEEAEQS